MHDLVCIHSLVSDLPHLKLVHSVLVGSCGKNNLQLAVNGSLAVAKVDPE